VYDIEGAEMEEIPASAKIYWHVPVSNTMINFDDGEYDTENDEYLTLAESITFTIDREFDYDKSNNNITVTFEY